MAPPRDSILAKIDALPSISMKGARYVKYSALCQTLGLNPSFIDAQPAVLTPAQVEDVQPIVEPEPLTEQQPENRD